MQVYLNHCRRLMTSGPSESIFSRAMCPFPLRHSTLIPQRASFAWVVSSFQLASPTLYEFKCTERS